MLLMVVGCGTQLPINSYDSLDPFTALVEELRVEIPPFLDIYTYAFSPDQSQVIISGLSRANDDGRSDPQSIDAHDLLLILDWPSLDEVYRLEDPEFEQPWQYQWSADRTLIWASSGGALFRLSVPTGDMKIFPFRHAGHTPAVSGHQLLAWGRPETVDYYGQERSVWNPSNEIFIYDGEDLVLQQRLEVSGVGGIGALFPTHEAGTYILATIADCNDRAVDASSVGLRGYWEAVALYAYCEYEIYRYSPQDQVLERLFALQDGERQYAPLRYNAANGLLLAAAGGDIGLFDTTQACRLLDDHVRAVSNHLEWVDGEHIADVVWPTIEKRTVEIVIYRVPGLDAEQRPPCIKE